MSGIEIHDGKASFVSARVSAYHQLGTILPDVFTAETALKEAHLGGWNVRKEALQTVSGMLVPERFASVRTNPHTGETDLLGTVGTKYTPIQNEDNCEILNTLVDESGAHFEVAGALKGGREVFVSMKMPDHMLIGGVDKVDTYISALNSHDGRSAFKLVIAPVRIECSNTQSAALKQATSTFTIRHTKNHSIAMAVARDALGLTFKYIDEFQQEAEKMIQQTMTEAAFAKIIAKSFGAAPKAADTTPQAEKVRTVHADLMSLFTDSPTATQIRGTRWAGYQAVTEYIDFFAPVRTKGDKQEARAIRALGETGVALKARAFDLLSV
jgi:phage/plasmid-like protein (TIGR03299 family)